MGQPQALINQAGEGTKAKMTFNPTKLQNLRGQALLFRCLETGFVTTAPALTRYQRGRGIDPSRRELVGERPSNWIREVPTTVCEHCGMVVKGNQWKFRQHQQTKRFRRNRRKHKRSKQTRNTSTGVCQHLHYSHK